MTPAPEAPEEPAAASYAEAVDELDRILVDLEDDDLDVDVLADRVRRAATLLAYCRGRIRAASDDVEKAVAALDGDATTSAIDRSDDPDEPF